jgi:DnaJ-class molecular chaperone
LLRSEIKRESIYFMAMSKRLAAGEELCSACGGTGLVKVRQQAKPGRRVYPPKCAKCGGRGRIVKAAKRGVAGARDY